MDDDLEPGAAETDPAAAGTDPAATETHVPGPPPPPAPPPIRSGWATPADPPGGPRLDVGSIVGRTFDTYGREWSLFLVLALPAGVVSVAQALVVPDYIQGGYEGWTIAANTDPQRVLGDLAVLLGVGLLGAVLSGIGALAMIVAADRMWQAQPTGVIDALRGALRATPRAIALWILVVLVVVAIAAVASVAAMILVGAADTLGLLGFTALAGAAVVGIVFVAVRLTPILVVLVAERTGVLGSVSRTWQLTRGHAIMLFVTGFVVALCSSLGSYGSSLIASATDSHLVAGLASGLASMIAAPLSAIWIVLAWGDLVGGRHRDSDVVARGNGRLTAAVLVAGLGAMLLIVGIAAVAGTVSGQTLAP